MQTFKILVVASVIPLFSACALLNPPEHHPAPPPAPAPVAVNPFAGFEQSRQGEASVAEQTRQDLLGLLSRQKNLRQTVIQPVEYTELAVTDGKSRQTRQFRIVSSLEVSLPLSMKKLPAYDQTVAKIKELAEKLADERGASEIQFFYNPTDVRAQKISLIGGVASTAKNNPVSVTKAADAKTPRGALRLVVKGGALPGRI